MRILELQKLADTEEIVLEILNFVSDDIKIVDEIADNLKKDVSANPILIRTLLSQISGAHSNLKTAWGIVETEKTNTQLRYYYNEKTNIIKDNPKAKFNVSATKEEARATVLNYRRVRNILQFYTESASQDISTLQSLKKKTELEHTTPGE